MDSVNLCAGPVVPPWYRWDRFPLVPRWWYRPENEQNRMDWGFAWLCLHVWTGIGFSLGVRVELDDQGLEIQFHVPWLHIRFEFPLFPRALHQKLWRVKRWLP